MAGMKKYFMLGIAAVALISIIVLLFSAFSGNTPAVQVNNTTSNSEIDEVLYSLPKKNHADIVDDRIFLSVEQEGREDVEFSVSSIAVHNIYYDVWYTINENATKIVSDKRFFKRILADTGLIYNNIYMFISEVTVNGTKAEMPLEKFFIPGDFIKLDENQNAYIRLTFLKDESVFETQDRTIIFAPQIRIESWVNVTLSVNETDVSIEAGKLWTNITVGMDNRGMVHAGLKYIG